MTGPHRCTPSGHDELKRPSQWPSLPFVGVQQGIGDLPPHELRNCTECLSTLAKELPR